MSQLAVMDISMRELMSFGFKYRRRLVLAFLLPFILAIIISFQPVPQYQATSVLIVRLGSEYVYRPEIGNNQNGPNTSIPFNGDQIFKSEVAILGSDDLHAETIKTIGLEKLYPEILEPNLMAQLTAPFIQAVHTIMETVGLYRQSTDEEIKRKRLATAVDVFNKHFDILLQKESAVINVTFEHKSSTLAVDTLDLLLKQYFEKRKRLYLEPRVALAKQQSDEAYKRLVTADQAVKDFKLKNQIYSFVEQRAALLGQRTEIEKELNVIENRQIELGNLLETLKDPNNKRKTVVLYDQGGGDLAMANARIRLIDAESRLKEAAAHYTKDSPVVLSAQQQVGAARSVLNGTELDRGRAESELGSGKVRSASLSKSIAAYDKKLDKLDALERDYNNLVREAKIAEEGYTLVSRQLDEAEAFEKLQRDRADSVRMIQTPSSAPQPKRLQFLIVFIGAFISLICVLIIAAATEFLSSGFYTPERLERSIGLPVLATIPLRQ